MPDQKQSQEQRISDASSQAPERKSAPLSIDEREDEGWDQPESSAQKTSGQEQEAPAEGE
jgi:hypothetical protein